MKKSRETGAGAKKKAKQDNPRVVRLSAGPMRPSDYTVRKQAETHSQLLQLLEDQRLAHSAGNKGSLAIAIRICGQTHTLLPPWVVKAWNTACNDVHTHLSSWDDVLGNDRPNTPVMLARQKKKMLKLGMLINVLPFLKGVPITREVDDKCGLFYALGKHLSVTARQAKSLYYELRQKTRKSRN